MLTRGVMVTCGLVGLFVAVANLALIATGKNHYGSLKIGQSIGLVAFCPMLVVAAFEARSGTETAFTTDTFNSAQMNLIALAEVAGAFLITQADFMRRLLGTAQLTGGQWGLALLAAVALLLGWEAGKWIARRAIRAKLICSRGRSVNSGRAMHSGPRRRLRSAPRGSRRNGRSARRPCRD